MERCPSDQNAYKMFYRHMDPVLRECNGFARAYIDNALIFTRNEMEQDVNIDKLKKPGWYLTKINDTSS